MVNQAPVHITFCITSSTALINGVPKERRYYPDTSTEIYFFSFTGAIDALLASQMWRWKQKHTDWGYAIWEQQLIMQPKWWISSNFPGLWFQWQLIVLGWPKEEVPLTRDTSARRIGGAFRNIS